jgi:hypothetical protein
MMVVVNGMAVALHLFATLMEDPVRCQTTSASAFLRAPKADRSHSGKIPFKFRSYAKYAELDPNILSG